MIVIGQSGRMIKTAVIIAGGASMRLRPMTDDMPKTLVPVNGKPILYWILQWLKKNGIEHVVIGVAYKKEMVYEYMKANGNFDLKVDFSEHTVEGGTAQAFKLAITRFITDEDFLAMNGDELTNMELKNLWDVHIKNKAILTLALAPFHCRFSVVDIGKDGAITGFERDKRLQNAPVHIGINIFNKKIIDYTPDTGNIEEIVFKKLVNEKKGVFSYMLGDNESWMSVNTQKDLEEANEYLTSLLSGPSRTESSSQDQAPI